MADSISSVNQVINTLQKHWVWIPNWIDSSSDNDAGRLVTFSRHFNLNDETGGPGISAIIHLTADTRYKLFVNGKRISAGPTRSCPQLWYYDTIDIYPWLKAGDNEIRVIVLRFFPAALTALPFSRTAFPGLSLSGRVMKDQQVLVDVSTDDRWVGRIQRETRFPKDLKDDPFLHWQSFLVDGIPLTLPSNTSHRLEIQADVHSTAFLKWIITSPKASGSRIKVMYSEAYEQTPREYPWLRTKGDRLERDGAQLIGPHDLFEISPVVPGLSSIWTYEPFWFRTFRLLAVEITTGSSSLELIALNATQVNYPLATKSSWKEPWNVESERIWDVSVRTLRNCMFDGYSDCPFYEQLQ